MQLAHIDLTKLAVSPANMRAGKKPPNIADILPSVRARGILVPLLVRANGGPDSFEIVAGRRRFFAAQTVAEEAGEAASVPCAVMEAGDDAAALEASLIENVARADPHEVEQWATFTRLAKEGRGPQEIALVFGLTDRQVRQVLALGNLLPKIRDLYRAGEIDPASVRYLTMATKTQQREWLAMVTDPDCYAPGGHQLKNWLLGGQTIATDVALFALDDYKGGIVADLFGEGGYFADAGAFWEAQNAAIAARREAYLEAGWAEVVVMEPGDYFSAWEYERTAKRRGGKVFVQRSQRGEIVFHEGYLTAKEAKRSGGGGEAALKPARSEVTSALQSYIDLHRHACVRAAMLDHPGAALRLMAAHAIGGSYLFAVKAEPQRAANAAVQESVETGAAEAAFDARRRGVLALLGLDPEAPTVIGGDGLGIATLFARLLALGDEEVMAVIAVVMGEALEAGSAALEAMALHAAPDMAALYRPDEALLALIRDKAVLAAMLAEVGGEAVASANAGEKAITLRQLIRDHIDGTNGRRKAEGWLPRWLTFPPSAYTDRGGVNAVRRHAEAAFAFAQGTGGEADADSAEPPLAGAADEPEPQDGAEARANAEVPDDAQTQEDAEPQDEAEGQGDAEARGEATPHDQAEPQASAEAEVADQPLPQAANDRAAD